MRGFTVAVMAAGLAVLAVVVPASAFNCPVVIKQAEDMLKKAEAKAHHENAKTKKDHGDAIRKAKTAFAYAEEAVTLSAP